MIFDQRLWLDLSRFHLDGIDALDTDRTQDIHDVIRFFLGVATCQPDLVDNPAIAQFLSHNDRGKSLFSQLIAQFLRLGPRDKSPRLDYKLWCRG